MTSKELKACCMAMVVMKQLMDKGEYQVKNLEDACRERFAENYGLDFDRLYKSYLNWVSD